MNNMEALLNYQEADIQYDKLEANLKNTLPASALPRFANFEDQKRVLQRMMAAVESRRKTIDATAERFDLYEKRYKDGIAKFEAADKDDPEEFAKFSQYFDQLTTRIAQERRESSPSWFTPLKRRRPSFRYARQNRQSQEGIRRAEGDGGKERADAQESLKTAKEAAAALAKAVDPQLWRLTAR